MLTSGKTYSETVLKCHYWSAHGMSYGSSKVVSVGRDGLGDKTVKVEKHKTENRDGNMC